MSALIYRTPFLKLLLPNSFQSVSPSSIHNREAAQDLDLNHLGVVGVLVSGPGLGLSAFDLSLGKRLLGRVR